ncbi:uncharacterized protein LOC106663764 [Cimex lectularius]|uniref:Uncharacterized protein n=1 Tax=Cimex lectularius TaxID=79782 RepID=A0A8I6RG76_CIMLE|nr:uncharacterized protein LOC106663764 [Cimex lectularius]
MIFFFNSWSLNKHSVLDDPDEKLIRLCKTSSTLQKPQHTITSKMSKKVETPAKKPTEYQNNSCAAKGELAKKFEELCPSCPPFHRTVFYSIPLLIGVPVLLRFLFCGPICVRPRQCSKIHPGCCLPKPTGKRCY